MSATRETADALRRVGDYTDGRTEFVSTPDIRAVLDEVAWLQARIRNLEETLRFSVGLKKAD